MAQTTDFSSRDGVPYIMVGQAYWWKKVTEKAILLFAFLGKENLN